MYVESDEEIDIPMYCMYLCRVCTIRSLLLIDWSVKPSSLRSWSLNSQHGGLIGQGIYVYTNADADAGLIGQSPPPSHQYIKGCQPRPHRVESPHEVFTSTVSLWSIRPHWVNLAFNHGFIKRSRYLSYILIIIIEYVLVINHNMSLYVLVHM